MSARLKRNASINKPQKSGPLRSAFFFANRRSDRTQIWRSGPDSNPAKPPGVNRPESNQSEPIPRAQNLEWVGDETDRNRTTPACKGQISLQLKLYAPFALEVGPPF